MNYRTQQQQTRAMISMSPCFHPAKLSDVRHQAARLGSHCHLHMSMSRCAHDRMKRSSPIQATAPRMAAPPAHGCTARRPLPPQATPSPGRRAHDEETAPGFTANYEAAMTMSALYSLERPAAIPLEEHERRRRRKDTAEIVEVSARGWGGGALGEAGGAEAAMPPSRNMCSGRTRQRYWRWVHGGGERGEEHERRRKQKGTVEIVEVPPPIEDQSFSLPPLPPPF